MLSPRYLRHSRAYEIRLITSDSGTFGDYEVGLYFGIILPNDNLNVIFRIHSFPLGCTPPFQRSN